MRRVSLSSPVDFIKSMMYIENRSSGNIHPKPIPAATKSLGALSLGGGKLLSGPRYALAVSHFCNEHPINVFFPKPALRLSQENSPFPYRF